MIELHEWVYWNITRHTQKILPWIARKLPKSIKYHVVIHGMVTVEPHKDPRYVTGLALLDLWQPKSDKQTKEFRG